MVREYDEAIAFFTDALRFTLRRGHADGRRQALGRGGAAGLRHDACCWRGRRRRRAARRVGNQTGGRVFLFLHTDDFWDDYHHMRSRGVRFVEEPREEAYGRVVVFLDLYGNKWDLVQRAG